jgi:ribose 1,5-bisphosphokinase PhnN
MLVCLIQVSREKLYDRLVKRGRETAEEIAERLERADSFPVEHPNLKIISNDSSLDFSANQMLSFINEHYGQTLIS